MDITPEVEYGVIKEVVSKTLYRPPVNPSNKFWIESTQTKIQLHSSKYVTL